MREIEYFCTDEMLEQIEKDKKHNYINNDDLKVEIIDNGIIHPLELSDTKTMENKQYGGVTDENLNFIELSLNKRITLPDDKDYDDLYTGANKNYNKEEIEYIDEEVVFIGPFHSHYGHFLLESLSRLWFYLDSNNLKYKAAFIIDSEESNYLDLITLFGLKEENLIKITKPTKFKKVIIPEQSFWLHSKAHRNYKKIIDRIKENTECSNVDKIFISKKYIGNHKAIGEKQLRNIFKKNGYKAICIDRLPIKKQIALLKGAKELAASSGSATHLSLFLSDGARLICLNRACCINSVQSLIDSLMENVNVTYIDCYANLFPTPWFSPGPFLHVVTDNLIKFFDKNKFKYNPRTINSKLKKDVLTYIMKWGEFHRKEKGAAYEFLGTDKLDAVVLAENILKIPFNTTKKFTIKSLFKKER